MRDKERQAFIENELFRSFINSRMSESDFCQLDNPNIENYEGFHSFWYGRFCGLCDMLRMFSYEPINLKDHFLILYRKPYQRVLLEQLEFEFSLE